MAFANRPKVIVLDEPTTALDVTTQAHVLDTVRDLTRRYGVAALYVTHDLAVVANLADRIAVMYAGRVVETGTRDELFDRGQHPYTRKLLSSIPDITGERALRGIPGWAPRPGRRPTGCAFAPRCDWAIERCGEEFPPVDGPTAEHRVRCWRWREVGSQGAEQDVQLRDKGLALCETPETQVDQRPRRDRLLPEEGDPARDRRHPLRAALPLAGRRVGLRQDDPGALHRGPAPLPHRGRHHAARQAARARRPRPLARRTGRRSSTSSRAPTASLNPRKTIRQILAAPLKVFFDLSRDEMEDRMARALEQVALDATLLNRYPEQLSGGERQRVAIARGLAAEPTVLICDEVTSWLDVSVQAAIIELLAGLQRDMGLSMLFVTHNLALVRSISQEVAVMNEGRIVEFGLVDAVLDDPQADYTKKLLSDTPTI